MIKFLLGGQRCTMVTGLANLGSLRSLLALVAEPNKVLLSDGKSWENDQRSARDHGNTSIQKGRDSLENCLTSALRH